MAKIGELALAVELRRAAGPASRSVDADVGEQRGHAALPQQRRPVVQPSDAALPGLFVGNGQFLGASCRQKGSSAAAAANDREVGLFERAQQPQPVVGRGVERTLCTPATTTGTPAARSDDCTTVAWRLVRTRTPMSPAPTGAGGRSGLSLAPPRTRAAPELEQPHHVGRQVLSHEPHGRVLLHQALAGSFEPGLPSVAPSGPAVARGSGAPSRPGCWWAGVAWAVRYTISGWPRWSGWNKAS